MKKQTLLSLVIILSLIGQTHAQINREHLEQDFLDLIDLLQNCSYQAAVDAFNEGDFPDGIRHFFNEVTHDEFVMDTHGAWIDAKDKPEVPVWVENNLRRSHKDMLISRLSHFWYDE